MVPDLTSSDSDTGAHGPSDGTKVNMRRALTQQDKVFRDACRLAAKQRLRETNNAKGKSKTLPAAVEAPSTMTPALAAWLAGAYPEPTTLSGVPIGPSRLFLAAPVTSQCGMPPESSVGMCSVCLLPAPFSCAVCRAARFCSMECSDIHHTTRCQKHVV